MFEFLRNLTKSADEKRQEVVTAYLDGALNDRERQRFEQEMAQDAALRAQVEQLLLIKQSLRQLPQREVPRNFILDPAAYGRPARQLWVQAYPVLRTTTALAAFFFIFAIAAGIFTMRGSNELALAPAADVAQVEQTEVMTFNVEESAAEAGIAETPAMDSAVPEAAPAEAAETIVEAVQEALAETAAAPQSTIPATQAALPPAGSPEEVTAEGEAGALSTPQETRQAQPTPSVSTIPRVGPPTPLPDRVQDGDAVAEVPEVIPETESVDTTAVLPEETVRETRVDRPVNTLFWLQIGLGGLLLLLLGLTFYARRQR